MTYLIVQVLDYIVNESDKGVLVTKETAIAITFNIKSRGVARITQRGF